MDAFNSHATGRRSSPCAFCTLLKSTYGIGGARRIHSPVLFSGMPELPGENSSSSKWFGTCSYCKSEFAITMKGILHSTILFHFFFCSISMLNKNKIIFKDEFYDVLLNIIKFTINIFTSA